MRFLYLLKQLAVFRSRPCPKEIKSEKERERKLLKIIKMPIYLCGGNFCWMKHKLNSYLSVNVIQHLQMDSQYQVHEMHEWALSTGSVHFYTCSWVTHYLMVTHHLAFSATSCSVLGHWLRHQQFASSACNSTKYSQSEEYIRSDHLNYISPLWAFCAHESKIIH